MKLFFREIGSGVPLVILHGLYGSSDNWVSIAKQISNSFRVIIPDQRNHGRSPHDPEHTYHDMSEDLLELVDTLDIDQFFLVGHSMGGKSALSFAESFPERILGLTIIDISPFAATFNDNKTTFFHKAVLDALSNLNPTLLKTRDEADNILATTVRSTKIRAFLLKNLTRDNDGKFTLRLNAAYLRNNLENILDGLNPDEIAGPRLSGFPIMWIRAGDSDYIPDSQVPYIEKAYPAAEIITIDDSSHWVHAEKPEEIIDLLLSMTD